MDSSPPPRPRRWRRRILLAVAIVAALTLFAITAVLVGLRSSGVRRALLQRVATAVRQATGIEFAAADFGLSFGEATLILHDVRAGVPGQPPLATIERVRVRVEPASLRAATLVIREFEIVGPAIDLAAPLPTVPASRPDTPQGGRRVEIRAFSLRDGTVTGIPLPAAVRPYITAVTGSGITAEGRFTGGTLEITSAGLSLAVERPGGVRHDVTVTASGITAGSGGAMRIAELTATTPGGRLHAAGGTRGRDLASAEGSFELAAEPAVLAPELGSGGKIDIAATLAAGAVRGHARATDLAAAALRGLITAHWRDLAGAAGTSLDLDIPRFEIALDHPEAASADLALTWRLTGETLLEATATLGPDPRPAGGIAIDTRASLLPAEAGARRLAASVHLPSWSAFAQARLEAAELVVGAPDLSAAVTSLRSHWPLLVPPFDPAWPVSGSLALRATATGTRDAIRAAAEATWQPASGGEVRLTAAGDPLTRRGHVTATVTGIDLAGLASGLAPGIAGVVSLRLEADGGWPDLTATLQASARCLGVAPDQPTVDELSLAARGDGRHVELLDATASLGKARIRARGGADLETPLRHAWLALDADHPLPEIDAVSLAARFDDGALVVDVPLIVAAGVTAAGSARVPLAALRALEGGRAALAALPIPIAVSDGPLELALFAPALDSCTVLPALGMPEPHESVAGNLAATAVVDLAEPAAATVEIVAEELRATTGSSEFGPDAAVRITVANRVARLDEVRLQIGDSVLTVAGSADLVRAFRLGADPWQRLVTAFLASASGAVPTRLAAPWLAGAATGGTLLIDARMTGSPADPRVVARLSGPEAWVFWPTPYATRIERPEASIEVRDGVATVSDGRFAINGGTFTFNGARAADGLVLAEAAMDRAGFRVAYGLRTTVSGRFELAWDPAARGLLSGTVTVDRGVLDRDLDLEREVLPRFLAPTPTTGTATNLLDTIDLELGIETIEGVRVRNNLADLKARWERLDVSGTAWNPVIRGRVEVEPRGRIFAYGQVIQLDRAVFTFTGDPLTDPVMDIATTSSLTDPTLRRDDAPADLLTGEAATPTAGSGFNAVAGSLASYLGERLLGRAGASLGLRGITIRPVLVFGEADPSARLFISRDLSRQVAFALSLDLRNAQRQTYLLDLHGFRRLPRFQFQAFTDDGGNRGGTFQQVLEFGGGAGDDRDGPTLAQVTVDSPDGTSTRTARAAVGLRKGDRVEAGALFDTQVEVEQALREQGFPDARVAVTAAPEGDDERRVVLAITVVPGPRVEVQFTGDPLPRTARASVAALARTDDTEAMALVDMQNATVRALRAVGYLDPVVTVGAWRERPEDPASPRTVTIASQGGRRVTLARLAFTGLPEDDAAMVARRFAAPLERCELAAGEADADRRVAESLRALGYPDGLVAGRELSADGTSLLVRVAAGPRLHIGAVTIDGVSGEEEARLRQFLTLAAGEPARTDRIAAQAAAFGDDLAARGFADARVRAVVAAPAAGVVPVRFEVRGGQAFRLGRIAFHGLGSTSRPFARRTVALAAGEWYQPSTASAARARLLDLGLFRSVTLATDRRADGIIDLTFSADEKPPWSIAYGVRWEQDAGASGVVDLVDRNFIGRGLTLGVRLRAARDDRNGRLYFSIPDILGTRFTLEAFGEGSRVVRRDLASATGGFVTTRSQAALQVALPLSRTVTTRVYARWSDSRIRDLVPDEYFPFDVRVSHPYIGAQFILDTRADPILGLRGVFATVDVSASGTFLGSDYRYLRGYGQLNTYRPIGAVAKHSVTWAQSLRVGLARAFDQELITDARFFAGGEWSVRGYRTDTLGPTVDLPDGVFANGGRALLIVNQELRVALPADLIGIVFADAGQVWAETSEFGRDLAIAVGIGVRAVTPVGVLRLDIARPLDRRAFDPAMKIYVGFGNVF